ncbi:MAG: TIGR03936 family radical SAM-associated protein [Hominimerdicola sp.]
MAKYLEPKNVNLVVQRYEYRLVYGKFGRAKYISHLDFMRAMQRSIKRAGLPVWYTQGFNPHVYIMFPLALPLGTDSRTEIMDIALTEELPFDEIKERLDAQLPYDMEIISVGKPVHKHTEIKWAEYEIRFTSDKTPSQAKMLFENFMGRETIEIEKRSKKKGVNMVDIKPHINVISSDNTDRETVVTLKLPAGNDFNLNANVVMDAYFDLENVKCDEICIERTKIMLANGEKFT